MLPELLLSLRSKSSDIARKSGLLHEQIAIHYREKRCRSHWISHRQKCQNLIIEALKSTPQKNRVLILGSGLFHEIPLKKLSDEFKEVIAVDIVHLPQARSLAKSLPNITLIEQDLTQWLYKIKEKPISKAGWLSVDVPSYFHNKNFDLVISANLLSQLQLAPKKVLENLPKKHQITSEEIETFCQNITDAHIQYLKGFKQSKVLLISDIETYLMDQENQILETQPLKYSASLPSPIKTWNWHVAPVGEVSPEYSLQMKVAGFILNNEHFNI